MGTTTQISYCYASPATIIAGESATLYLPDDQRDLGHRSRRRSVRKAPTAPSSCRRPPAPLTRSRRRDRTGATATCSVAVTVTAGAVPQIIQFSAAPMTIVSGASGHVALERSERDHGEHQPGRRECIGERIAVRVADRDHDLHVDGDQPGRQRSRRKHGDGHAERASPSSSFTATPNPSTVPGSPVNLYCTAAERDQRHHRQCHQQRRRR